MTKLSLTKTAVGCASTGALETRNRARTRDWQGRQATAIYTRYRPTRHEELVGGSLYWIIKHIISVRQEILGFEQATWKGKPGCRIWLAADMRPVSPRRKRAHQGWRYLEPRNAPADLMAGESDVGEMPQKLVRKLAELGLV
ncbi:MAG: DUF1489 domain-containing protein [Pacificimonas sp.]